MKNILMVGGLILLFIFGTAVFNSQKQRNSNNAEIVTNPTAAPTEVAEVPLPQETDIIRTFVNLIDEGKTSDAVMIMSKSITSDDSTKQAYGVQFAAMNSVKIKKIEESSKGDWTETKHQYMVTLDVEMNPSSANEAIPYYGFERGDNIRFINIIKEDTQWRVEGLATGP